MQKSVLGTCLTSVHTTPDNLTVRKCTDQTARLPLSLKRSADHSKCYPLTVTTSSLRTVALLHKPQQKIRPYKVFELGLYHSLVPDRRHFRSSEYARFAMCATFGCENLRGNRVVWRQRPMAVWPKTSLK